MSGETSFANARIVTPDAVVSGRLIVRDGRIEGIEPGGGRPGPRSGLDLDGDYLLPGLIDLHTDALEKHIQPRSGVVWDAVAAAVSHDAGVATAGITTVFDSVTIGSAQGWDSRDELLAPMLDGVASAAAAGMLRAEHLVHLRCEAPHPEIVALVEALVERPDVRLMSLMDHAPGDRQVPDMEDYKSHFRASFRHDEAALAAHVEEMLHRSRTYAPTNRRGLAARAAALGLALASHDDATADHVAEAAELGVTVAEFPTTAAAAGAARRLGIHVLMGSPNLIRGRSASGNVRAGELASLGLLDILASDYIPASLLPAAFRLAGEPFGFGLPAAIATVTAAPADAAGLADRGRTAPGLRADLVRVRVIRGHPVVRGVWRAGERVA